MGVVLYKEGGGGMTLKCSATISGKDEREQFIAKIQQLGLTPNVAQDTVFVRYEGYNRALCEVVIETFEDQKRHSIDYC